MHINRQPTSNKMNLFPLLQLCFLIAITKANAKKICTKKFHKISNSVFFQRTETSSAEKCIERCIEELEHCKAAVFTHNKTKSNGLCQLYAVNSQSEDVRIEVDGTLNPVSTVFEVLDKCAVSLSSNKDDIANRLEPELKQKLEEWTDQPEEKHEKATESESDDTQKSTESSGESHRKETSESIHTEHPKTKIAVSEFNEPHIIPEDNQERSSDRSRFRTLVSTSSSTYSRYESSYIAAPQVSSRGQWVSGVYDGRNFGLQPVPIRPTQVLRGGAPISCAGANCYAPAVVVSPQLVYSPCPALAGDPCAPHPPPPCQTVSQQAPCAPPITSFPQTAAQPRAVEAFWSEWSPLTPCSVTCGSGIAQRRRFCSKEGQCSGTSVREEPCEREPCDQWSPWSDWSSCTRSCGGGEQERRRFCVSGRNCEGPSQDARRCNEEPCAAEWTPWSRWEPCSVTCGLGKQQRFRQCVEGLTCLGRPSEERPCEAGQCPSWSPWQPWSECSKSCDTGQKFRSRFCEGGRTCDGNAEENVLCNQQACPEWIEWTQWSTCSETCGAATKLRTRECMYKNVRSSLCEGAAQDQAPCRVPPCPEWSDWNDWSPCSVTCGHGQQLRRRKCLPSGASCIGGDKEYRFCQDSICPYWDQWSPWSGCSVTCGIGTCERRRKCVKDDRAALPNIEEIIADAGGENDIKSAAKATLIESSRNRQRSREKPFSEERRSVYLQRELPAEVLVVSQSARTKRDSTRSDPFLDATDGCVGNDVEKKPCNAGPCCELSHWSPWTSCSASCGGGRRSRQRQCLPQGGFIEVEPQPQELRSRIEHLPPPSSGYPPHSPYLASSVDSPPTFHQHQLATPIFAGLQPIIPVKQFSRLRRQAYSAEHVSSSRRYGSRVLSEAQCRCTGALSQQEECNTEPCATLRVRQDECIWSSWGAWCGCTGPCNLGTRVRNRYCDSVSMLVGPSRQTPSLPDESCHCPGEAVQTSACIPTNCSPLEANRQPSLSSYATGPNFVTSSQQDRVAGCSWSSWNPWGACVNGIKTRTRSCIGISAAAIRCQCVGPIMDQVSCISSSQLQRGESRGSSYSTGHVSSWKSEAEEIADENRDRDYCNWETWSTWSTCSVTCGSGEKIRKRHCPCRHCNNGGSATEVRICEFPSCEGGRTYRRDPFD